MEIKKNVNEKKERNDNDVAIFRGDWGWLAQEKERIISVFIPDIMLFATLRLCF